MLKETLQKYKNQIAFTCMGKDMTYKELNDLSTAFGAYL